MRRNALVLAIVLLLCSVAYAAGKTIYADTVVLGTSTQDAFITRSAAGTFTFGTTAGATDGTVHATVFTAADELNTGAGISVKGGYASAANSTGGLLQVRGGGAGAGASTGGAVDIIGGMPFDGTGGDVTIRSSIPLATGSPGNVNIGTFQTTAVNIGASGKTTTIKGTTDTTILDGVVTLDDLQADSAGSTIRNALGWNVFTFAATQPAFYQATVARLVLTTADELRVGSNDSYAFASGDAIATAADTWIGRTSAGAVYVGATTGTADGTLSTGTVLVGDGTAGAPSVAFASDPTTGIFTSGSDVQISAAGVAKLQITSGQNLLFQNTRVLDGSKFKLGSGDDAEFVWGTANTNHGLVLGIGNGSSTDAGYFAIHARINDDSNYALAVKTNPTLVIYSQTAAATATDEAILISHDVTDGLIETLSGNLSLQPFSGTVEIGASGTGTLHTGSIATAIATKTATYTTLAGDHTLLFDATSAPLTANLIPVASVPAGTTIIIKKIDSSANAITIDANLAETIDGATTQSLSSQYSSLTIQSDGTTWWIQ